MTIAQRKIIDYCKDNNENRSHLSMKLGYSRTYLGNILAGVIPSDRERKTINDFFGIIDRSKFIPDMIYDKYYFSSVGVADFNRITGYNVHYRVFNDWRNGKRVGNKKHIKALCEILNIKNEWFELDNHNTKAYNTAMN